MSLQLQVQMARRRPRICWRIYYQQSTKPTKHKETTITRLAFLTQFCTCLRGQKKFGFEMGQDHLGDIHLLSELAHPKTAIVTLVGEAHLAFFKDRSEIAKGKMQIADGMASGSLLLAPADSIVEDYLPTDKR